MTLYCNATGNPLPTISWGKNGNPIGNNSKISYSAERIKLKIINVYRTDSGTNRCVAVNSIGDATSRDAKLVVELYVVASCTIEDVCFTIVDRGEITTNPSNVTKREGENVTLHCNATGNPLPTLSWTKYGSHIGNNPRISFSEDKNQFTITNAKGEDSGAYRCVAINCLGNNTSGTTFVNVQFAPEISKQTRNNIFVKGENVIFSCSVEGNPTPSVVWTKNGEDLDVTANSRLKLSSKNNDCCLEIAEVHLSDSGLYICVANNSVDVSHPPKDLRVISRGSRLIYISWTAGFDGNSAIQNYTVEIRQDGQIFRDAICQGRLLVNACVIYTTRVSIRELFPWTTYYLRVFARNIIGSSNYSFVVDVTTHEEEPGAPPENLQGYNTGSTSIKVTWIAVRKDKQHGDIIRYTVMHKKTTNGTYKSVEVTPISGKFVEIKGLDRYTYYDIKVSAATYLGNGPASEPIKVRTDEDVPSAAPTLVSVQTLNSTSIQVEWLAVPEESIQGIPIRYTIYFTDSDGKVNTKVVRPVKDRNTYQGVVPCLKESTEYSFQVSVSTAKGEGPLGKEDFCGAAMMEQTAKLEEKVSVQFDQYWSSEDAESYGDTAEFSGIRIRTRTGTDVNNSYQLKVGAFEAYSWP
ncbi:Netrin receptor DCC [Stylophora pistillata]|uniref:Netrin receptor DCC n=1 Tax=Stylophora pistillata TaxID=50429 RepID=A0A2B4RMC9_STYPI|nr:Netrin receptor DCC [Stylophora pistillata]